MNAKNVMVFIATAAVVQALFLLLSALVWFDILGLPSQTALIFVFIGGTAFGLAVSFGLMGYRSASPSAAPQPNPRYQEPRRKSPEPEFADIGVRLTWMEVGENKQCEVFDFPALIGRSPDDCHVAITERTISRKHARLTRERGGFFIEDLQSANGTTLDGALVTDRTQISPGQLLRVGMTSVRLEYVRD